MLANGHSCHQALKSWVVMLSCLPVLRREESGCHMKKATVDAQKWIAESSKSFVGWKKKKKGRRSEKEKIRRWLIGDNEERVKPEKVRVTVIIHRHTEHPWLKSTHNRRDFGECHSASDFELVVYLSCHLPLWEPTKTAPLVACCELVTLCALVSADNRKQMRLFCWTFTCGTARYVGAGSECGTYVFE